MNTTCDQGCGGNEPAALERVRYFPRQLLTADDLRADQEYARQRQRRFNRFVIGWGVVCGLEVVQDPKASFGIQVCPGFALDPWGQEIYLPNSVAVDLGQRLQNPADPCTPAQASTAPASAATSTSKTIYVAVRYHECLTRPVRTTIAGCGCDETECEYSRIRDGYQIGLLAALPASHARPTAQPPSLCDMVNNRQLPACPPCPVDAWVVIATLTVTTADKTAGSAPTFSIDAFIDRRILFRASILQQQEIDCCCAAAAQAAASTTTTPSSAPVAKPKPKPSNPG